MLHSFSGWRRGWCMGSTGVTGATRTKGTAGAAGKDRAAGAGAAAGTRRQGTARRRRCVRHRKDWGTPAARPGWLVVSNTFYKNTYIFIDLAYTKYIILYVFVKGHQILASMVKARKSEYWYTVIIENCFKHLKRSKILWHCTCKVSNIHDVAERNKKKIAISYTFGTK